MMKNAIGALFCVSTCCLFLFGCQNPRPTEPTEGDLARFYPMDTSGTLVTVKEVFPNNVLVNGSFDEDLLSSQAIPSGWEMLYGNFHDETTTISLGIGRLKQGKSVQLQGTWCHLAQVLSGNRLEPFLGHKARVSLWCRTTHPKQMPFMRMDVQVRGEDKPRVVNIGMPAKDWSEAMGAPWTFFTSTMAVPKNTEWLRVDLANKGTSDVLKQHVVFDDVVLEIVE